MLRYPSNRARPTFQPTYPNSVRPRYSVPRPLNSISAEETFWKSRWPFLASTLLGIALMICAIVIFALDIALVSSGTDVVILGVSFRLNNVFRSGVGIWGGSLLFLNSIFIIIPRFARRVIFWLSIAFWWSILGASNAIIVFSINASRVQTANDVNSVLPLNDFNQGKLAAAQIPFGVIAFLLCLGFIFLFLLFYFRNRYRFYFAGSMAPPQF